MSQPRFFLVALTFVVLSGCMTYEPRDLSPATTQAQLESRTLGDAGLKKFLASHGQPAEVESWDLARLTLAAFHFNPELDVARAQLAGAEAGVRSAAARPNPTFAFTPGYNQDSAAGVTPWILDYALDLPLELAGKRTYRTAEAQHQAEAARLEVARLAWSVRASVRRALSALHAAEATAGLWRNQTPLLASAAQLVDLQVKAGEVSPLEAAQARITLNRAELAARESERGLTTARSRLAETIGLPLAALAGVPVSYRGLDEPAAPFEVAEARRWAAQNRADLLAALAIYAASQSALQVEIARQYPDLSFGPGYQLDQGEGKWSLGLGVTLPVFHQNQGPIAVAQARREAAAARFLALQNRVLAEVDRASADYSAALADLATVKSMRANLEQQARTIRAQQAAGETSRLELTRAQIELADNARAELEIRLRVENALGALEDAVQRPLAWPESAWRSSNRPSG
ncbi:MAG: TolC family protein [Opitutaceae bacterium]|nr:TolC family protein [Opitutaceae bacterium]